MKQSPDVRPLIAIAVLSLNPACADPFDAESDGRDTSQQAVTVDNALTSNALTSNALTSNALTSNALTANALTSNALTANALTVDALHDPAARMLLKYVVGCALPAGESVALEIDGETYRFPGSIGLARSWGRDGGSCDRTCRGWVSGCVLSRVDYLGEAINISIRGEHHELSSGWRERVSFTKREGTYYGDIFASPPRYYACVSPNAPLIPRVCGPSANDCVMDIVGQCDDTCGRPRGDRSFPNCRDHVRDEIGRFPGETVTYKASVTVFLK